MSLRILPLPHDRASVQRFISVAWQLNAEDPQWVPPFKSELEHWLAPDSPFLRQGGELQCFLAERDGQGVARCAAMVDRRLTADGSPVGQLGFYEAANQPEASQALLDAAFGWLAARGVRRVWGPMNFSIWHGYRFMVRGFERSPFAGEPRNPPYYPEHFEAAGFTPLARYHSWDLDLEQLRMLQQVAEKMADRESLNAAGLHLAPLDLDHFESQMEHVHRLLTEAFSDNLGFVPIHSEDFMSLYGGMKAIAMPEIIPLMWSREGQAVGFGYLFPDYAQALRKMNGESGLLGKLRFLLGRERPDRLILHTVAVQKDFRRRGMVETVLADLLHTALARGFTHAVGALAKEGRTLYDKAGPPSREYRLYSRAL